MATTALLVAALSGCLETPTEALSTEAEIVDPLATLKSLGMAASSCRQNGALSIYPLTPGEMAGPYEKADIREAMGFQPGDIPSVRGMAAYQGPVWGNWHLTMACESHTFNGEERGELLMGFVAMYVKAPAWDTSGARHQWLVDGISFSDEDWGRVLGELTGSRIGVMERSILDWRVPGAVVYMEYDEGHHGWFEITSQMRTYAKKTDETYRFWIQVPYDSAGNPTAWENGPSQFRPLGLDLIDTAHADGVKMGGLAYLLHYHGNGELAHNGDEKGVLEMGFDRSFKVGDHPELYFPESWIHF
ncbi:MAG TPA: hypothetical protein VGB18_00620 [Candidatus Thermoplasmatota archaeon]